MYNDYWHAVIKAKINSADHHLEVLGFEVLGFSPTSDIDDEGAQHIKCRAVLRSIGAQAL